MPRRHSSRPTRTRAGRRELTGPPGGNAPAYGVVMSQEAYSRFSPQLKPGGILITEQELVHIDQAPTGIRMYGVPATNP